MLNWNSIWDSLSSSSRRFYGARFFSREFSYLKIERNKKKKICVKNSCHVIHIFIHSFIHSWGRFGGRLNCLLMCTWIDDDEEVERRHSFQPRGKQGNERETTLETGHSSHVIYKNTPLSGVRNLCDKLYVSRSESETIHLSFLLQIRLEKPGKKWERGLDYTQANPLLSHPFEREKIQSSLSLKCK